jgi:hypothetical protein
MIDIPDEWVRIAAEASHPKLWGKPDSEVGPATQTVRNDLRRQARVGLAEVYPLIVAAFAKEIRVEVFDATIPNTDVRTGTHGADAWMCARANFDDWCDRHEISP